MNGCCGHVELAAAGDDWKGIIDEFAQSVYDGKYNTGEIPMDLYFKTADRLANAIVKGMGSDFGYDEPGNMLTAQLKANLYQFSGAKSLTESLLFAEQITDENGQLKPFSQYRDDIEKIHQSYNLRYLSAEYDNAVASAQMALKWRNYEAIGTEYLEYRTIGDARVRPEHAKLDGLVLAFDSPVWSRIWPPNDFGCRCTAVPADKPATAVDENAAGKLGKQVVTNPVFENNVGKTGLVFKDNHPYFKAIDGKLKELDAIKNYGMKPVDKLLENPNLPAAIHMDTEADYLKWWNDMVKQYGVNKSDFVLTDKVGTKIVFDATPGGKNKFDYFRDHILQKTGEKRYEFAANLRDIIESPDEIWSVNYLGKVPTMTYIKYYDGDAIVINATIGKNKIKAETMFKLDNAKSKINNRKGILMYKK